MFSLWQEARGSVLKKAAVEALDRWGMAPTAIQTHTALTFLKTLHSVEQTIGPISNISGRGLRSIAKRLSRAARQQYKFDVGAASGTFLAAAHLEAAGLPGKDAAFVLDLTNGFIRRAREIAHEVTAALDIAAKHHAADETVKHIIEAGQQFGAATAREAVEMTMGRSLSDREWETCRRPFEEIWLAKRQ